jgi:DNA-binding NtrC family response regulator
MKQKVLLMDDDDHESSPPAETAKRTCGLGSLHNLLSSETYEIVLAESVQDASAKSYAGEIDLLLMNLESPTEEGWAAIGAITEANPFLPVIVVTRQPELRSPAEAAGVCALVQQPVDVPMLLQTIRELLGEPAQKRLGRVCNRVSPFRYVPSSSRDFRDLLHRRDAATFRFPLPTSRWGIGE